MTPLPSWLNVVLLDPEIPQNTGSIGRLCVGTRSRLHLVGRIAFSLEEKAVRRAGLDYWLHLDLEVHRDLAALYAWAADEGKNPTFFYTSKDAPNIYTELEYKAGDYIVFGCESVGLPRSLVDAHPETAASIPQFGPVRSLNVATAAGIVIYEALRQIRGF